MSYVCMRVCIDRRMDADAYACVLSVHAFADACVDAFADACVDAFADACVHALSDACDTHAFADAWVCNACSRCACARRRMCIS
jgi:hypothetical protein